MEPFSDSSPPELQGCRGQNLNPPNMNTQSNLKCPITFLFRVWLGKVTLRIFSFVFKHDPAFDRPPILDSKSFEAARTQRPYVES